MSHKTKAKAKGISTGSFFDLKAELSKQEADFAKAKAAGGSTSIVGGVKRPDKKPTVWARQNKGVSARSTRDIEQEIRDKPKLESARAVLERKAKIYEKLRKGKSGGLNDAQYSALLVDFDSAGPSHHYDSDSDDVDESLTVPARPGDDDPIVEYEDEFGRLRSARRSEVPRHLLSKEEDGGSEDPTIEYEDEFGRIRTARRSEVPRHLWPKEADPDADSVIYNPVGHFPVYEPTAERIAAIEKKEAELNAPLAAHYDASKEVRAKGAGFYQFSADEETRKKQMDDLQNARVETEKAREEAGAMNLRPGEVEGMREGDTLKGTVASRAMEKRKREIEERRKLIEAKRRKVVKPTVGEGPSDETPKVSHSSSNPVDPFAILEAQATKQHTSDKPSSKAKPRQANEADAFLANLEEEFLNSKKMPA